MNPSFKQSYAIACAIPKRTDADSKRRTILFWCKITKQAIGA